MHPRAVPSEGVRPPPLFAEGDVVLHVRSARHYQIVFGPQRCCLEAGRVPAYAYRLHVPGSGGDPMVWVRNAAEMEDGRFERVLPDPGGHHADA